MGERIGPTAECHPDGHRQLTTVRVSVFSYKGSGANVMYHVYEQRDVGSTVRLIVLSDDDWTRLTALQRANYRLRAGGFRTGLEAVLRMIELVEL